MSAKEGPAGLVNVLLVYEEVPEDTKVYRLQVTASDFERMSRCHGRLWNHSAEGFEADLEWLDTYLTEKTKETLAPGEPLSIGSDCRFILTGILL